MLLYVAENVLMKMGLDGLEEDEGTYKSQQYVHDTKCQEG